MAYILVVEDDDKIAQFILNGLKQSGHSVEHATNATYATSLINSTTFDIIIVDIMLEGEVDGIQMVKSLRNKNINIPVIFLSARDSVEDKIAGFDVGADDYISKPFSFTELNARIVSILRRTIQNPPTTKLTYADIKLDMLKRQVHRDDTFIELRRREFMLLQLLMENREQVLGKTMILERIWGYDFDPQTNIVDVLVSRLRAKIDKGFDVELIHTVRGVGYVLRKA